MAVERHTSLAPSRGITAPLVAAELVTERCADRNLVASDTAVARDGPGPVATFVKRIVRHSR
jgi:hypothetical protein